MASGTAATLLYVVLLAAFIVVLLTIVLLPAVTVGVYFFKWKLPSARRGAFVQPGESLLCGLKDSDG
jgi:hypothetical protein